MTKSLIITFEEVDENFLMILFKKFRIKTQAAFAPNYVFDTTPVVDDDPPPTKEQFLQDLRDSVAEMHAHQRGEIELPSFDESIRRIKQELAQEELVTL